MANDFDNTALNATIPELWDEELEQARYANGVIFPHINNKSSVAQKKGDIIHVTIDQKWTVGTVGSDGSFAPQNYTPTTVDITLNQWEQIALRILDRAEAQSFFNPATKSAQTAGAAFAARYDAQIAALHGSVGASNIAGSTVTPAQFDKTLAQEAMLRLANANVPMDNKDDLSWCLHPISYYNGILNEAQLTSAADSGQSKNVLTTGSIFNLFGAGVYLSTNIVEAGNPGVKKNLLLHKSAIAIAWQKNTQIDRVRAVANLVAGDIVLIQSLYGLNVIRSDHFVVINSAAN